MPNPMELIWLSYNQKSYWSCSIIFSCGLLQNSFTYIYHRYDIGLGTILRAWEAGGAFMKSVGKCIT